MPATVTLATATLTYSVTPDAVEVQLSSVSGVDPGDRLWIDRELMKVNSVVTGTTRVKVNRGVDGTAATRHASSAVVTVGRADQFYTTDPVGSPAMVIPVSPYINAINGRVWMSQGDALPDGNAYRWWQEVTQTYGIGPLGVRTQVANLSSST
jgi:hypothetical protein